MAKPDSPKTNPVKPSAPKSGASKKKPNFIRGIGLFFKRLVKRIIGSFRDMFSELKKVTWPTRSALINYTLVVLAFMVLMGVIIYGLDTGAAALVQLMGRT
jgi:preprotein translocase subunit SecE